jgi:lipopolysaccharide heptosyltransferase I
MEDKALPALAQAVPEGTAMAGDSAPDPFIGTMSLDILLSGFLSCGNVSRILIVKPSALGDVIHSLPFLNALKVRYPLAEIHWVIARGIHEIIQDHPLIHRLWIIDKNSWKKPAHAGATLAEIRRLARAWHEESFDMVVDLQGLLRSGVMSALTGSKIRLGFRESREGSSLFYSHRVTGGRDIHAVDRYLKMAAFLGCDILDIRHPFPPLPPAAGLIPVREAHYAVMAPAAGTQVKRWPPARFGELASKLSLPSLIIGGESDTALAQAVVDASRGAAESLAGRLTLKELAAVIKGSQFMVCNDTGPMHMAAALGVPVFALFGPTNPARTGPYGKIHTVIRAGVPCSPCYRRKPCKDWRCMTAIGVDDVLESIHDSALKSTLVRCS